jgi:membrane associated rhomboid family serine protease
LIYCPEISIILKKFTMFFPIGDDNVKGGSWPFFTYVFLILNVGVFGFMMLNSIEFAEKTVDFWGYRPVEILAGSRLETLISSMFLHGGWLHLIGNMLFLWVFADNIEAVIGHFRFIIFYILGGLAAAAAHVLFNMNSDIPCVGASGAIAAVLGAYLVMFPSSRVKILVFLCVFFPTFDVPAFAFLGIWIVQQIISGYGELSIPTADSGGGVAWWAHIGGFVFGFVMGLYYRSRFDLRNWNARV